MADPQHSLSAATDKLSLDPPMVQARDYAASPKPTPTALNRPSIVTTASAPTATALSASRAAAMRSPASSGSTTPTSSGLTQRIPPSLQAKMAAMASRAGNPSSMQTHMNPQDRIATSSLLGKSASSSPALASSNLAKRRGPGLNLSSMQDPPAKNRLNGPGKGMKLPGMSMGGGTPFSNFSKIVDPSGSLNFDKKAVLHAKGVDFSNGSSFNINMGELTLLEELGSGNYGTVQKVFHKVTKVTMAMKEIRLELDDSKLKAIITELDILHRATSPEIIDFYGAFFIESCVYYCMEYMDAGSLDKLAGYKVPEDILAHVTICTVRGLRFLKDELQTMHRDVKPTNVLVNTAGAVKLCDFGVSGQLERSLAKTNIGCQSYMAPERIRGESQNFLGTYTVSSDVWSLGLSIIEFALGHYPYPPETYSNVFAQLQAIVHGEPPTLTDSYSPAAHDFVSLCLKKDANERPSYKELLEHDFLKTEKTTQAEMAEWVKEAVAWKQAQQAAGAAAPPTGSTVAGSSVFLDPTLVSDPESSPETDKAQSLSAPA